LPLAFLAGLLPPIPALSEEERILETLSPPIRAIPLRPHIVVILCEVLQKEIIDAWTQATTNLALPLIIGVSAFPSSPASPSPFIFFQSPPNVSYLEIDQVAERPKLFCESLIFVRPFYRPSSLVANFIFIQGETTVGTINDASVDKLHEGYWAEISETWPRVESIIGKVARIKEIARKRVILELNTSELIGKAEIFYAKLQFAPQPKFPKHVRPAICYSG